MKQIAIIILVTFLSLFNVYYALGVPNTLSTTISPDTIQFQLIDPLGNITGYEPKSNSILENIPNTMYELHAEETTDGTSVSKYNKGYNIGNIKVSRSTTITSGKYILKLFAPNILEKYSIELNFFYYNEGDRVHLYKPNNIIYPNVIWIYEFTVPIAPSGVPDKVVPKMTTYGNSNLLLTKVASPQDLIIDINAAGQLGYIGNSEFVSEITKKINKIEEKRLKPDKNEEHGLTPAQKAKKEYTELLSEITEKYNKPESDEYVKKESYDVLKEDMEYIINHIQ